MISFILVKVQPGKEKAVTAQLVNFPEVKESYSVYGAYDIILKIETKTDNDLDHFVFHKLRVIDGVLETLTFIVAEQTK
ncbi:MAG: Lrp/AsnC family transcriptional regulator [Candidatus Asgardarchaeia archaeon]